MRKPLRFKYVPLSDLHINPKNPRVLKDTRFKKLCNLMTRNPKLLEKHPILARADGTIYDGNQRYKAAEHLGWTEIPADIDDIDETTATEWSVILNNHAGEFDDSIATILDELEKQGVPIEDLCMSEQIEKIIEELNRKEIVEDEAPAPPKVAKSKLGDLYILGNHRLLCGDATKLEDLQRLMGGGTADMVFTDPPYGVDFKGKKYNPRAKDWDAIENDTLSGESLITFIQTVFENLYECSREGAPFYCWSAPLLQGAELLFGLTKTSWHLQSQIIWAKNVFSLGQADYQWKHEICWYGYKGKHHTWNGGRDKTTLWEVSKDALNTYVHPMQKPVELSATAMRYSSDQGGCVIDVFGGSGSTLMGCEQMGRCGRIMEKDPLYVDCILERWENFTGKKAEKL